MSIPVEIDRLADTLAGYGTGYLLTCSAEGRIKAVTVEPELADGRLQCQPSRGTAANVAAIPAATLLFPPREERGYTLLVDGTAEATDDAVAFTPDTAVLHRPASHADGPEAGSSGQGCGHDCAPVV